MINMTEIIEKTKVFLEELDKRSKDATKRKNLTALKDF